MEKRGYQKSQSYSRRVGKGKTMTKKWIAIAIISASKFIAEIEADTKEEAREKAENHENCNTPIICHSCTKKIEIGDIYRIDVIEDNKDLPDGAELFFSEEGI